MSNRNDRTQQSTASTDATHGPNPKKRGKLVSALIALVGLWMILEVLVVDLVIANLVNDLLAGILLLAVGGYNYYRQMNEQYGSVGAAAVAALVGAWILVAPFVFGGEPALVPIDNNVGAWNNIVLGLIALALGAYSAYKIRDWQRIHMGTAA